MLCSPRSATHQARHCGSAERGRGDGQGAGGAVRHEHAGRLQHIGCSSGPACSARGGMDRLGHVGWNRRRSRPRSHGSRRAGARGQTEWIGWKRTLPVCRRVRTGERPRPHLPAGLPRAAGTGWHCLTDPDELAQFWGPRGMTAPIDGIVVELRPGGRFETLMLGAHGSYRMVGTFTEVVPPDRLAWIESATGMHTTSTLHDLGDGTTEVVIRQRNVPRDGAHTRGPRRFSHLLDKLEEHLARLTQADQLMTDPQSWVAPIYTGLADLPRHGR